MITPEIFKNIRERGLIPPIDREFQCQELKDIAIRMKEIITELSQLDIKIIELTNLKNKTKNLKDEEKWNYDDDYEDFYGISASEQRRDYEQRLREIGNRP